MPNYVLASPVELGEGALIGDYVVLGALSAGSQAEPPKTRIGPGAVIRSHTVIYAGTSAGARFQTGHGALVRERCEIGDDVSIGSHSVVEHRVVIGNRVRIHSSCFVPEFSILEDDAWLGPMVVLTNAVYPKSAGVKEALKGPIIMRGAKIGANVTVLPGVVIGRDCLVGAGSVVVKDVPDGAVVVGSPARITKNIVDLDAYACRPAEEPR